VANTVANSEIDRKEQAWAREERSAATRGAGTEVRAVAAKAGGSAESSARKSAARRTGSRTGSRTGRRIARRTRRSASKNVARSRETVLAKIVPAETVPGKAKPGRVVYAPPRS